MFKLFCELVVIVTIMETCFALDDHTTISPLNSNILKCMTDDELLVVKDVMLKIIVDEVKNNQIDFTWDTLQKLNLADKEFIDKIIENAMNSSNIYHSPVYVLQFINKTSNSVWKLDGYRTVFNIMSSNESVWKKAEYWLPLQHFLSHSLLNDSTYASLLTDVELNLNQILVPPDFGGLHSTGHFQHSWYPPYAPRVTYYQYLIKRFCSLDPQYIENLFVIFHTTGVNAEMLLQIVTALEENNRLNYTSLALPYILRELRRPIDGADEKQCYMLNQLKMKLPANSIIGSALLPNQTFHIKSAYNQDYMYHRTGYEQFARPLLGATKNSTWKFAVADDNAKTPKIVIRNEMFNNGIGSKECEIHDNEWFVTLPGHQFEVDNWKIEVDDIFTFHVRIRSDRSGRYLRADGSDLILSHFDEDESSKFEWILEMASNHSNNIDTECGSGR